MTKDDLKHALISLAIGVLTMALTQFVTGIEHILATWLSGLAGGSAASVSYLHLKNYV